MIGSQRNLFTIPEGVKYLNCAYQAPLLKTVVEAGITGIKQKSVPYKIGKDDFFEPPLKLRRLFGQLIGVSDVDRIVQLPSASYGVSIAANNIPLKRGDNIVVPGEQFPSNIYSWIRICDEKGAKLRIIDPPESETNRGKVWNERILESIDTNTVAVSIAPVQWADGTLFNLTAIRERCNAVDARLIIDGTQSIGARPFDQAVVKADAVICAGYKWLLGPYSIAMAYFGECFDRGRPIEENWINRQDSDQFANLVNYQPEYRPKAQRYAIGEYSNFILVPMLIKALEQLLDWGPESIHNYCSSITESAIQDLSNLGFRIESSDYRASHLFGIRCPEGIDAGKLKAKLDANRIYTSSRGNAIRVSPHLYNTEEEMLSLAELIKSELLMASKS